MWPSHLQGRVINPAKGIAYVLPASTLTMEVIIMVRSSACNSKHISCECTLDLIDRLVRIVPFSE